MSEKTKNILFTYIIATIVIFAFVLRFPYLNISPLGDDESYTVYFSSKNLIPWETFRWGSVFINGFPPLDFIYNHFVFKIFGITASTARYIPTIFDILTVAFMGILGFVLCNRKTGVLSALFWAISPCAIFYAMEARPYAHLAFASILYILSFCLFVQKRSLLQSIVFSISIIYGFNVSILFVFPVFLTCISLSIYFLFLIIQYNDNRKYYFNTILHILLIHIVCGFAIVLLYNSFKMFDKTSTIASSTAKYSHYYFYSFSQLWNRLIIRIYDTLYAPFVNIWGGAIRKKIYFLIVPALAFAGSLFVGKKYLLLKIIIIVFFLGIPALDTLFLYIGGKHAEHTYIRYIYYFVPVFYLGLAFSINIIFDFFLFLTNKLNLNLNLQYTMLTLLLIISVYFFDYYVLSQPRDKVQHFYKSNYHIFNKWLENTTANKKVLVVHRITNRTECRLFTYLCSITHKHSSNIFYRLPAKFYNTNDINNHINDEIHNIDKIDPLMLEDILKNNMILAYAYSSNQDFPYDKNIFNRIIFDRVILYTLKPVQDKLTCEEFSAYSNFFGSIFIKNWNGDITY